MEVKSMCLKNYKLTCPECKRTIEDDNMTNCILNLPHKRLCPGNKNPVEPRGVWYSSSDWEDRKLLLSDD